MMMLRANLTVIENILWPAFKKYSAMLENLVKDIVSGLISQFHDVKEGEIVITWKLPVMS
jgi:hypothetical protein